MSVEWSASCFESLCRTRPRKWTYSADATKTYSTRNFGREQRLDHESGRRIANVCGNRGVACVGGQHELYARAARRLLRRVGGRELTVDEPADREQLGAIERAGQRVAALVVDPVVDADAVLDRIVECGLRPFRRLLARLQRQRFFAAFSYMKSAVGCSLPATSRPPTSA